MTTSACGFPEGRIHDHGASQCHEASRRAGAVDALREAIDAVESERSRIDGHFAWHEGCVAGLTATLEILRADLIARGMAVSS